MVFEWNGEKFEVDLSIFYFKWNFKKKNKKKKYLEEEKKHIKIAISARDWYDIQTDDLQIY